MNDCGRDELRQIPGVGKAIAGYMRDIGINSVDELRGREADELYQQLCEYQGVKVDRCMLYIFRCAIYYASNTEHDPELLKWYNWGPRARQRLGM